MDSLKFRRFLSLALAFLMVLSNVPVQAFATETDSTVAETCAHNVVQEDVTVEATCETAGEKTFACLVDGCGYTWTETVEALGHSYADGTCATCGGADPDYVPPHEHTYENGVCTGEDCGEADPTYVAPETPTEAPTEAPTDATEAPVPEKVCAEGCILEAGHEGDCEVWVPCEKTEGCELVAGHDGECTGMTLYEDVEYVASIGDTGYETLEAAVSAVTNGEASGTIQVLQNVQLSSVQIIENHDVVLDLGGYTVTMTEGDAFHIQGSSLKIDNGTLAGSITVGGMDTSGSSLTLGNELTITTQYSAITVLEGSVTADNTSDKGANITVEEGNVLVVGAPAGFDDEGNKVYNANADQINVFIGGCCTYTSKKGAGIYIAKGTVTLGRGTKVTSEDDYALKVKGGTLNLNDSGAYTGSSGALYVEDGATVAISESSGNGRYQVFTATGADATAVGGSKTGFITCGTYSPTGGMDTYLHPDYQIGSNGRVSMKPYVAEVNGVSYETLADAVAAVENGQTIVLKQDITIDSETYTIADGKSITLDMGGKTITVTDNKTANYELFYIYGGLTVTGNGTIELTATTDRDWNAMSVIFHNRGGVLNIENGTFTHNGGTDMAFVVDNSGNYYGDATTNIKAGTLTSSYIAIRNRMEQNSHGASGKAILNVSGGTISGTSRAIWAQAASASTTAPATGEINISGGTIGLIDTARSEGAVSMTTITGGTVAAFKGEVNELTVKGGELKAVTILDARGNAVDYTVTEDGLYVQVFPVMIGAQGYATLQAAVEAAVQMSDEAVTIVIAEGTYAEDLNLTNDAIGNTAERPNITFQPAEGAAVTLAGTVTVGYRQQNVGASTWNGEVTFKGITFDHAENGKHSLDIQDVNGITLDACTITGDGEYGIGTASGNSTTKAVFTGCTFNNGAMQVLGQIGAHLKVTGCTMNDFNFNVQAGATPGMTIEKSTFNMTLTDAHVGESFYAVRTNACPVNISGVTLNVDSTVTGTAAEQAKWAILHARKDSNAKWTVSDVEVNLTSAAAAQTELLLVKNAATEQNADRITITGMTSTENDVADLFARSEGYMTANGSDYLDGKRIVKGTITPGYVSEPYYNGVAAIWGEATSNAQESFVINIYADETLIATTTLTDLAAAAGPTWHAAFTNDGDTYWNTVWTEGHPNKDAQPTKVELVVDGTVVATNDVKMSKPDGLEPVVWKDLAYFKFAAKIGDVEYKTLAAAAEAAKSGDEIVLLDDVTLASELTLPAGVIFNGNGYQVNGTIYAGGDLTFKGHTKVTSFSATYYDRTITIGEGACLEVTGTGRVTLGYGNTFNITGSIENAKTADKAAVTPSLIIPGGMSITGDKDAAMNVTNAYVKIGNTSSKNSAADGTFTLNFTNSIVDFTNQFTLSEPTNGKNPTFNVTIEDSVVTTATKLCVAAANSTVVVDNSTVTLSTYLRNSGSLTLQNGSVLTGSMIQFGENGGNDGTITVDASELTITNTSTGHAMDGNNTGKLVLTNGGTAKIDYIIETAIEIAPGSSLTTKSAELTVTTGEGCEVSTEVEDGYTVYKSRKLPVAKVGDTEYGTIDEAIAAWTNGTTLTLLADVTLSDVIQLSSTEYHVLDLGTYTMTAASKKDAIQIVNNGRSSASYALDIKADATNPGGITATGKTIVVTTGKSGVKDRPIIRFYNGVFNASYIVNHSGSNGTNCPQFYFYGGEYNGTISTNRSLNQFYGGTFNGSLMMSVDSSAYTLVSGGTFKQLSNLYNSALNSGKFTIGSSKGVYDRDVYVDDNGYYVVSASAPTGVEASVAQTPGTNDYFAYSKVATEGKLNYTDVNVALANNKSADVTIYTDKLDLTSLTFNGTLIVPENQTLTVIYKAGSEPKIEAAGGQKLSFTETAENGIVTRTYRAINAVAQIGDSYYESFEDALAAACADSTITEIVILCDSEVTTVKNTSDYYIISGKLKITAPEGENYTVSVKPVGDSIAIKVQGNGASLTIGKGVTINHLDVVANGFWTQGENMVIEGTLYAKSLKQWTSNDSITVTKTGKVILGNGDGQFDFNYGNGTVTITGTGDKTAPQFKAGYTTTQGNADGNILNLKDTYFEGGAWFNMNGKNATVNADNTLLKVSGGDAAGSMTIASTGNTINLTNGSELAVANLTIGAGNTVKLDATSKITATKITGAGTIVIDATGMTAGVVTAINADASGFTGDITVTGNEDLYAEIVDGKIVLKNYAAKIGETRYETLAEAIEEAKANNVIEIIASELTFDENAASIVIDKAVTIKGAGKDKTKLTFNSATSAFVIQSSNVTFEGMTIVQGAKDNSFHISVSKGAWDAPAIQYSDITIKDIAFEGGDYALCLIGEDVTVDNCSFTDQDSHNIIVYSLKGDSKIINNTFNASKGNNKSAILYEGGADNATDLSGFIGGGNLTISGNTANGKGVFFQFTNWGKVEGMNLAITGNKIDAFTNKAIALYDMDGAVKADGNEFGSVTVTENVFTNVPAGRPILKEYTGTVAVDASANYLGSAAPDYAELLQGEQVTVLSYYKDEALTQLVDLSVAKIGNKVYTSLQAAVDAAQNGDTVTLLADSAESITVTQKADVKFTIDGSSKTMTGSITVDGKSATITSAGLTIKDVNFSGAVSTDAYINLGVEGNNNTRYVCNLTVEGCSFNGNENVVAIKSYTGGDKNLTVKNCTATGVHSLIQVKNVEGLTVTGGSVTGGKNGISVGNSSAVVIDGTKIEATDYGVRADGNIASDLTVKNAEITANDPIVVRKATAAGYKLDLSGNDLTANNESGYHVTFTTGDDGTYDAPNVKLDITTDTDLKVFPAYVANIGDTYYTDLSEALKALQANDTLVLLDNVTITEKWDNRKTGAKITADNVTIDGNGKTITFTGEINDGGNYSAAFRFEADATVKNLTIDMSAATPARIRAISAKGNLTVEGCTFIGNGAENNNRAIIFGEGAGANVGNLNISVTNSTFTNWRRGLSDNENGQDVKTVTATGNTFTNAGVNISAAETVTFTGNTVKDAYVTITSYAENVDLSVTATGNTLTANTDDKYNAIYARTVEAQDAFVVEYAPYKVSNKAELNAALAVVKDGDTIILTADIDYGTDQLKVEKAITLDLGGNTLTTRNAYGGMSVKNNATVKNGTIVHASNTAAIKVWNAAAFEDLTIDVQGKGDANKTIGGIVLQSGSTTNVGSIKNVTIKGEALTNGIETYNCGDAAEPVIGSLENVSIDANGTAMLISAPVGTATGCTFDGGVNGIELWIKGTYSASLDLVDCDVIGGVFAHDEFSSNPDITNNGTLKLTVDDATTGASEADITLTIARAEEGVQGVLKEVMNNAKAKVNDTYYATLTEAMAAVESGDTVTMLADAETTAFIGIDKSVTINGNGHKITSSATRVFRITASDVEVTLNDVDMVSNAVRVGTNDVRGISVDASLSNVKLTLNDCSVDFTDASANDWAYAVNVSGSGTGHTLTVNGGTYEGANVINVHGANNTVTVKNATLTSTYPDNDMYAGACIWVEQKQGSSVEATGNTFNGRNAAAFNLGTGTALTESNNTDNTTRVVAKIGETYYVTFAEAYAAAAAGDTITLLAPVVVNAGEKLTLDKAVTITYTSKVPGEDMITNRGTLVVDGATLVYTNTDTTASNVTVSTISCEPGSVLEVKSGTVKNDSANNAASGIYAYAIDLLTNGNLGDVTATISGGEVISTNYMAIRQFNNGTACKNTLTVIDGYIYGAKRAIQIHLDNNAAYTTISGGKVEGGDYSLCFLTGSGNLSVTGGTFLGSVYSGTEGFVTGGFFDDYNVEYYLAEGYALVYKSAGMFGVEANPVANVAGTDYTTLQAAIDAAAETGDTVYLKKNIVLQDTVTVPAGATITLNLKGYTVSQKKACTENYAMILNKGNLTITGNGKISFTDTGAGDSTFSWGTYTVRNEGTLTVENGTIEHLGAQAFATHCIQAIFQYSGSTTINGGTISTPNYRSVRLWKGDMTINGGTFDGQVWVHCVDDSAKLTINGGSFSPNGNDGSSVFVNNSDKKAELSVTGGTFETKIGANDAAALNGPITGGIFTEDAKNGTNTALIADGFKFVENADGTYGVIRALEGSGTESDPYKISNVEELILFRDSVNAGETIFNAEGVYVALTADIDLTGIDWNVNIGAKADYTFDGIFDGNEKIISNMTVAEATVDSYGYICTGLFGAIGGNAVIKDLTIKNASITSTATGNNAGVVVGFAYSCTGSIENVKVINSTINAKNVTGTGAIVGYVYGGSLTVKNCSVEKTNITGAAYVGGIIGYGSNAMVIENCSVKNSEIKATSCAAGGIAGILLAGGKIIDAAVTDVKLSSAHENWQNAAAAAVGSMTTGSVTVSGEFKNITVNGAASDAVVGSAHAEKPTAPVAKVEAHIGDVYYTTFAEAYAAAKEGETITLLTDLTLSEALVLDKAITLNGNGKTLITTADRAINVDVAGEVSIKDLTIVTTANTERAINVIQKAATLNLDNVTAEGFKYTINVASSSVGSSITINGGKYSGYAALNITGDNTTVKATNAEFIGANTYAYHESNAFAAIAIAANNVEVEVSGGKITATSDNGNVQAILQVASASGVKATIDAALVLCDGVVFNGSIDQVEAAFRAAYADELNAQGFATTEHENDLVKVSGASVAKNAATAVYYGTVEEALAAAKSGETVMMVTNATTSMLSVLEGITLDLNGYTLTASYVVAFNGGNIVDNSESNAGRLAVDSKRIVLSESNKQLPVKTESGYMFADIIKCNTAVQTKTLNGDKFVFQPWIELTAHEALKQGSETSDVNLLVRVNWTENGNERTQLFTYSDDILNALLNSWNGSKYTKMLTLTLTGLDTYVGVTYEVIIASDTGMTRSYSVTVTE